MCRAAFMSLIVLVGTVPVSAQTTVFKPLATWQTSLSSWESSRPSYESSSKLRSARPILAGLRPLPVELLQDALLRKRPKLQNDAFKARQKILEQYLGRGSNQSRIGGRSGLYGDMAEAMFLHKNPEWKYVSKSNASQHDVYRNEAGRRPPLNGQVKFHESGRPSKYASDMVKDHRAHRFYVPDDHVQPVREYWLRKYEAAKARGDAASAKQAARNAGRVQPIGVNSQEVVSSTKQASQFAAAEARMVYIRVQVALLAC